MLSAIFEILLGLLSFLYYSLEAIVLFFVPLKLRFKNVAGQTVLVTGAGGGIGRLIAVRFAKLGCKVVCWDVAPKANEETARAVRAVKGQAFPYRVDLTNKEDIYRVAQLVKKDVGKVDILINNAGVVSGKPMMKCSDEEIKRTFDVNILAHFWTCKSFLPDMMSQNRGHIVTIASLAGLNGINRLVDYCSSKFAAVGFDEALRVELEVEGYSGIKTTVVCPYFVKTPLFDGINSKILPVLEPEEVARETERAVLAEEQFLVVPRHFSLFVVLKALLPSKALARGFYTFGLTDTMNHFQGSKTKYD